MGGRRTTKAVALLSISVLLACAACTKPKPKSVEQETAAQIVIPTMQLTPEQTAVPAGELPTPASTPTSEVPVVPLPTATLISTVVPTSLPTVVPTLAPEGVPEPSGTSTTYIVQRGETLFSISQQYGVSWQDIAQANGIVAPYQIVAGQKLTIPQEGSSVAPADVSGQERIHVVQQGENLFRIGLKYGVPWQDIAQANGITDPSTLFVGKKLVIP